MPGDLQEKGAIAQRDKETWYAVTLIISYWQTAFGATNLQTVRARTIQV